MAGTPSNRQSRHPVALRPGAGMSVAKASPKRPEEIQKCPGQHTVKAQQREHTGGEHASMGMQAWPDTSFDEVYVIRDAHTGEPLKNTLVELLRDDGATRQLVTDAQGRLPKQQAEWIDRVVMRAIGKTRS